MAAPIIYRPKHAPPFPPVLSPPRFLAGFHSRIKSSGPILVAPPKPTSSSLESGLVQFGMDMKARILVVASSVDRIYAYTFPDASEGLFSIRLGALSMQREALADGAILDVLGPGLSTLEEKLYEGLEHLPIPGQLWAFELLCSGFLVKNPERLKKIYQELSTENKSKLLFSLTNHPKVKQLDAVMQIGLFAPPLERICDADRFEFFQILDLTTLEPFEVNFLANEFKNLLWIYRHSTVNLPPVFLASMAMQSMTEKKHVANCWINQNYALAVILEFCIKNALVLDRETVRGLAEAHPRHLCLIKRTLLSETDLIRVRDVIAKKVAANPRDFAEGKCIGYVILRLKGECSPSDKQARIFQAAHLLEFKLARIHAIEYNSDGLWNYPKIPGVTVTKGEQVHEHEVYAVLSRMQAEGVLEVVIELRGARARCGHGMFVSLERGILYDNDHKFLSKRPGEIAACVASHVGIRWAWANYDTIQIRPVDRI